MKLRNLLLAGLAAAAITACSNGEEFVDNGIQAPTGELASMRINFSTPAVTRSSSVTPGGADEGSAEESAITTATIVLDYAGSKRIIKNNLTLTGTADADKVLVASTPKFEVTAGSGITIYVFINPSEALNTAIESTADLNSLTIGNQALPLAGFLETGIAMENKFLMSGLKSGVTIIAGTDANEETIEVNRISAKLEETTGEEPFALEAPTVGVKNNEETLAVAIIGHSYSNLVKNSYVLSQTATWKGADPYLQPYSSGNYEWINSDVTYCLENKVGGAWNTAKGTATNVQYKGQVYYVKGSETTKAGTFFVKTSYTDNGEVKTIYKTWAAMKADYNGLSDTEGDADYLKANEIVKYVDGICYYEAPIQDVNEGCSIIRNNWYQLTVTKVDDLGWPGDVPPPPTSPTMLKVNAKIMPWTIHVNNIEL